MATLSTWGSPSGRSPVCSPSTTRPSSTGGFPGSCCSGCSPTLTSYRSADQLRYDRKLRLPRWILNIDIRWANLGMYWPWMAQTGRRLTCLSSKLTLRELWWRTWPRDVGASSRVSASRVARCEENRIIVCFVTNDWHPPECGRLRPLQLLHLLLQHWDPQPVHV